jgi:hypothetical protein
LLWVLVGVVRREMVGFCANSGLDSGCDGSWGGGW